jgi:hypothetical protein
MRKWSIGIYSGRSPYELLPYKRVTNPVVTADMVDDIHASFVADPFMIKARDKWHMFFEAMNTASSKGEIAYASSPDGIQWEYGGIVLSEPFHLSYPYVLEWRENYYMVPETHMTNSVRLYVADIFPTKWRCIGTLLDKAYYADASLVHHQEKWWLFADMFYKANDTLGLYYAPELWGPWNEHPKSPVIAGDPGNARPAGRLIEYNGRLVRFAQDCSKRYGLQVRAFEVTEMSALEYCERRAKLARPILWPTKNGWNSAGMHHVDPHLLNSGEWLACVDGSAYLPEG